MRIIPIILTFVLGLGLHFSQAQTKFRNLEATALSSEEQEAAEGIMKAFFEALNQEDIASLEGLLADDFKAHNLWEEEPSDAEDFLKSWTGNFERWENINSSMAIASLNMSPPAEAMEEGAEPWDMVMLLGQVGWDDTKAGVEGIKMMLRIDAEVADGKIVNIWSYFDRQVVEKQYEAQMDEASEGDGEK